MSPPVPACTGRVPYLETHDACDKMLSVTLNDPWTARMIKKPVITATDEYDVAAMFKDINEEYMATGKPKGGTRKRLRYSTLKVVALSGLGHTPHRKKVQQGGNRGATTGAD